MKSPSHLPDTNNSIGYEDKKNDNRLNKGGGRLLSFLKQCQRLGEHKGHKLHSSSLIYLQEQL